MQYWDTSTLAKLYISESDSSQFAAHLAGVGFATSSELARWEIFRVLARKEAEGFLSQGAAEIIFNKFLGDVAGGRVLLVPLAQSVATRFREIVRRLHKLSPPLIVRTLDGIHLATAQLNGAIELVATDTNMRKCATALGMKTFP